jgi:hypothetical protein
VVEVESRGVRFEELPERVREEVKTALSRGAKPVGRRVCPRCGLPFKSLGKQVLRGNTYYYAIHFVRSEGRTIEWPCYLGPREYILVTKLHESEGLTLRGAIESERFVEYVREAVETKASVARVNPDAKPAILRELLEARRAIDRGLAELGAAEATKYNTEPPKATARIINVAGKPAVEISYNNTRLIQSVETFKKLCENKVYNPQLCEQLGGLP